MQAMVRQVLAAMLSISFTSIANAENDLSTWAAVQITASVYHAQDAEDGQTKAFVEVSHAYSNTLSCDLNLSVKVEQENGSIAMRTVRHRTWAVFPKAAFGYDLAYPLPVSLSAGERLADAFESRVSVFCRGWDASVPLSDSLCKNQQINPGHERACSLLHPNQRIYPWIRHGAWLGSCHCG